MTIKHLVALAAMVGGLSFTNLARAADGRSSVGAGAERGDASAAKKSPAANGEANPERLSEDVAEIEADFRRMQKDCDHGDYQKAEADLDLLLQHRRQYALDRSMVPAAAGDRSRDAGAQSPPPSRHPGK